MRDFIRDFAFLSYAAAFGGVVVAMAAFCYGEMQAAMIATIVYITAPIIGVTLQTIADAR